MDGQSDIVSVRLTQQQIEVLERLRREGDLGSEYSEILLNAFRRYSERFLGKGRFGNVGRAQSP
jgi:hypothetical protein